MNPMERTPQGFSVHPALESDSILIPVLPGRFGMFGQLFAREAPMNFMFLSPHLPPNDYRFNPKNERAKRRITLAISIASLLSSALGSRDNALAQHI
jgi:hypothetical protein